MNRTLKTNFVRKDGVIKEQVGLEEKTRRRYDEKWSFLTETFNAAVLELAQERGLSDEEYKRRQPMITLGAPVRVDLVTRKKRNRDLPSNDSKDEIATASGPIPLTSSGMVGWRAAREECSLEKGVGPLYISPRHTMVWESIEIKPTKIILG